MFERRLKPLVVPIFVPHAGCSHRCIFCDQERITSEPSQPVNRKHIEKVLDRAIHSKDFDARREPEVAFFGGTFTSLPIEKMKELLEAAASYIRRGFFRSIRASTRPDAIDEKRLEIMKSYGAQTLELGAQSMDDHVLSLSKRGHTVKDTVRAVEILRRKGFSVGIQLMPGMPGDSENTIRSTITKVIQLQPDMVRLYPALVIRGTELALWYSQGRYTPLALKEAVEICIESCIRLEAEDIPVIRIGLMSSPSLLEDGQIVAGPWHPSFGFLVRSGIYQKGIEPQLPRPGEVQQMKIYAREKDIPLLRGYKNEGLKRIEAKAGAKVVGIEPDASIMPGRIRIQ